MTLTRWVLVLVLLFLPFNAAVPQESEDTALVNEGFVKTEDYLGWERTEQSVYAAGLVDGMFLAPVFDAPNRGKYLIAIQNCVKGMSNKQVAAIIIKYAKEHPEKWHIGTNLVAYQALREVCPVP
jgi:hypothetical protein